MKTFIYLLIFDTLKGYVGKSNKPPRRFREHINDAKQNRTYTHRSILKLAALGKLPPMLILEEIDVIEWRVKERFWVAKLKAEGWVLTNHTSGGDGLHDPDEETLERMRAAAKARYLDPVIKQRYLDAARNPIRRKKISNAHKGRPKSKEHIANLPQNNPGFKFSKERNEKMGKSITIANLKRAAEGRYKPNSAEHNRKIGLAHKGKPIGKGRNHTEEHKQNIAKGVTGIPRTAEWKKNASIAAKARWEKVRQSKIKLEKIHE